MRRYAKDGVTPEILDAYRLPQLVRGWEWGLLRFLRARVAGDCLPRLCLAPCSGPSLSDMVRGSLGN